MNDETKGAMEWLRSLDKDDRDYHDAQRIIAHIDGEPLRQAKALTAAQDTNHDLLLELEKQGALLKEALDMLDELEEATNIRIHQVKARDVLRKAGWR